MSHMYSDRMSSRPMSWSEEGADAMCRLRCYVKDYGEEKILELLLHHHDNDRVYIEKMQATIPSIDIRKKLAIRERLGGI